MERSLGQLDAVAVSERAGRATADVRFYARAAGLAAAAGLCFISIRDPDLPWHLTAARWMAASRAVPRGDFLSWTMGGKPWIDFEWASEMIFYALDRAGGAAALWSFRAAALLAVAALMLGLLRRWGVPKSWDALAAPAFVAALYPLIGMRPELFSLLLFLIEFHLLEARRLGESKLSAVAFVAWHAPMYAIWANLHAGFVAGLTLCACYGLAELARPADGRTPAGLLAASAGLAGTLVNPYGPQIYGVLIEHLRRMPELHELINEWGSPDFGLYASTGYWLAAVFSFAGLLALVRQGGSFPAEHLAVLIVFGALGSRSVRSTMYEIIAVFPLGLDAWHRTGLLSRRPRAAALAALAAISFAAWRGGAAAIRHGFFGWPKTVEDPAPTRAFDFLRREAPVLAPLRLYNTYSWGGFVEYALWPRYRTFIDGRYLFADLLARVDAAERAPDPWGRFIADRGVQVALVDNSGLLVRYPWDLISRPLTVYAWPKRLWALVYWDDEAMIFVRRTAVPPRWLKRREYRLLCPMDYHHTGLLVVGGRASAAEVEAEIARYRREIGDPEELSELDNWWPAFRKSLSAGRRKISASSRE